LAFLEGPLEPWGDYALQLLIAAWRLGAATVSVIFRHAP